jgi:hypothetical protein
MALARKDVERDRITLALKERMEEAKERANTGGLLRKALNQSGAGAIGEFMSVFCSSHFTLSYFSKHISREVQV